MTIRLWESEETNTSGLGELYTQAMKCLSRIKAFVWSLHRVTEVEEDQVSLSQQQPSANRLSASSGVSCLPSVLYAGIFVWLELMELLGTLSRSP